MKTNQYLLSLILMLAFVLNVAMIQPNSPTTTPKKTQLTIKKKKVKRSFFKKIRKKIKAAIDGVTLVWAILGIVVGAIAIYYFFTLSFFVGILAIVVVTFALYQLFRYFQY
jgi:hypothetical protein